LIDILHAVGKPNSAPASDPKNMDHYSYLIDEQHRYLLIGIVALVVAMISACTGTVPMRGPWIDRIEDPKGFWWGVVLWFVGGVCFIVLQEISN
jgi:di/tricarboxylate transporter